MRSLIPRTFVAAGLGLALWAPAARAFDLTGHWTGKWSCSGFDGSKFRQTQKSSPLAISQTGSTVAATIDGSDFAYNGFPITDSAKPDKGELILLACPTSNSLGESEAEILRAQVATKSGSVKASIKGTSIFADNYPEAGTCKYTFKRVDTEDPGLAPCP